MLLTTASGLVVIDVSDSLQPEVVDVQREHPFTGNLYQLDTLVVGVTWDQIRVYSISDPLQPVQISPDLPEENWITGIERIDSLLVVTGLRDESVPHWPHAIYVRYLHAYSLDTYEMVYEIDQTVGDYIRSFHNAAVHNDTLYIATDEGLQMQDLSGEEPEFTGWAPGIGACSWVHIADGYLYLQEEYRLAMYEIPPAGSNLYRQTNVRGFSWESPRTWEVVNEDTIVTSWRSGAHNRFSVVAVGDPDNNALDLVGTYTIDLEENYTWQMNTTGVLHQLSEIDGSPGLLGYRLLRLEDDEYHIAAEFGDESGDRELFRIGQTGYVANSDRGTHVLDLSPTGLPDVIGHLPEETDIKVHPFGEHYVGRFEGHVFRIYSYEFPLQPYQVGSFNPGPEYRDPLFRQIGEERLILYYRDEEGIYEGFLLDVSDPSPDLIAQGDFPLALAGGDNYLFAAEYDDTLQVYDFNDPDEPGLLLAELNLNDDPGVEFAFITNIEVDSYRLLAYLKCYHRSGGGELTVSYERVAVSLYNPARPRVTAAVECPEPARDKLWTDWGYHFMLDTDGLLHIYDLVEEPAGEETGYYRIDARDMLLDPPSRRLLVATGDRVMVLDASEAMTTTLPDGEERDQVLPGSFTFAVPYPNPFNATTRIGYTLPVAGHVAVSVVDILGRRVATLQNGPQPAGAHSLLWDGHNMQGRPVASGVYFVTGTMSDATQVRSIILVK
ncbi:T9SS type A sorting domain-containing protein [bacterium]|nr:T9SS type A sorting domain-containing protein [bacterium]